MGFQVVALDEQQFSPLFDLTDDELARHNARRFRVEANPGYPCRVTLEDAAIGETVIGLPFQHLPASSPYQASGPIFVRGHRVRAQTGPNVLPIMLRVRPQSIRGYGHDHLMQTALIATADDLQPAVEALLARSDIAYLHLHNANPGCFNCRIERT